MAVAIYPFIEQQALFDQYNPNLVGGGGTNWAGTANTMPPNGPAASRSGCSCVRATAWPDRPDRTGPRRRLPCQIIWPSWAINLTNTDCRLFIPPICPTVEKAAFGIGVWRRFADFYDGTSNTLMLGEYLTGVPRPSSASDEGRGEFWADENGCSQITTINTPNSSAEDALDWCWNDPSLGLPCHDSTDENEAARHGAVIRAE